MPIKNIVFDLGGVVLNLDQERTLNAFGKLGANLDELNASSNLLTVFETGKVHADHFLATLQGVLPEGVEKSQILESWNAMLLDLPDFRVDQLRALKSKYRLFLLSNTNSLHIEAVYATYGNTLFEELFERIYLSHEMGLRKPNVECYQFVIQDAGIKACETVFVDDSIQNLKGAETAGMNTILAKEPLDKWFDTELRKMDVLSVS